MGSIVSVLQDLESKVDATLSSNTSDNYYSRNGYQRTEYACEDDILGSRYDPTQTYQTRYLPNSRSEPSQVHKSGNNYKVKSSAVFINENTQDNNIRRIGVGSTSREKGKGNGSEVRWIKHYNSCQRILVVGDGDFSFSACLATAFGLASNMVATSLDSQDFLVENYGNAFSNLLNLSFRKCRVMHEVDATTMANHESLRGSKFDRIIFNFPFAGFFKNLPRNFQLRHHMRLVSLFLKNAKEMIMENGEIHISHKTNGFHSEWNLELLASFHGLYLIEAVDFNLTDYPGYNTKCGFGGDNNFNCYPSMTYKFGLIS